MKVLDQSLDRQSSDDYAVFKARSSGYRKKTALSFRTEKARLKKVRALSLSVTQQDFQRKVAGGAKVRSNNNGVYFVANLDTYGGNSGSAVFNLQTREVEGILVRGENDYVYDYGKQMS